MVTSMVTNSQGRTSGSAGKYMEKFCLNHTFPLMGNIIKEGKSLLHTEEV